MDPLREAVRRDPDGPAVAGPTAATGQEIQWSWAELDRRADETALRLAEAGVRLGDGVAALLPPSPEAVVLLHALPRTGALFLPLNTRWTSHELRRGLEAVPRPRLLVVTDDRVSHFRSEFSHLGTVALEELVDPGSVAVPGDVDAHHDVDAPDDPTLRASVPEPGADTPVVVILTSGSTGSPRAVPLTHGNLMASARGAAERLRLGPADMWLASLSPAHVGGLALLHRAAVVGCPVVTRPAFDPEGFLELARAGEISHASLVPVMLRRILEVAGDEPAPRALRCLLLGGAPTPPSLLERALQRRWPVALTYGLTEASSQVATAPPDRVREKPGCVGRPLPGVQVAVRRPDARGVGELLVRGATVAPLPPVGSAGDDPDDPPAGVHVDRSGWLRTGDLGRLDGEGDLWIAGRASDRIVSGGVTVEPAEVEEVLLRHPGVAQAAVTGVSDPEWGDRVVGVVVAVDPLHPPAEADLLAHAGERLAPGKRPRALRIVRELPRNANGKVDRRALREGW